MKNLKSYNELMSNVPNSNIPTTDEEILRAGIIAELDAINLYEQMAKNAKNSTLKKVLLDIAKEEKTHVGEFEALLNDIDKEHAEELKNGKDEVDDLK
jgi:rubrerythrin